MSRARSVLLLLALAACSNEPVGAPRAKPAAERTFGSATESAGDPVDVAHIMANPKPYLNTQVKCAGTVARVCQAAGCWLELRASDSPQADGLRVPMAGHSFFVPQDIVGRPAVVEGTLAARELNPTELGHLQGEGLQAIGPLYLAATRVVVR